MTLCPNTHKQCVCQPQEGTMCPYGPTPEDWNKMTNEQVDSLIVVTQEFVRDMDHKAIASYIGQEVMACIAAGKTSVLVRIGDAVEPRATLVPRFSVGDKVRSAGGHEPRAVVGMFVRYRVEMSDHKGYVCIDEDALEAFPENRTPPL